MNATHIAVVALAMGTLAAMGDDKAPLRLVPWPKKIEVAKERFALDRKLELTVPRKIAAPVGSILRQALVEAGLAEPRIQAVDSDSSRVFTIGANERAAAPPADHGPEAYALSIRTNAIQAAGADYPGLIHAAQTLAQLIRANRDQNSIPCLEITDWPSLKYRAFQDDMTRGPSSTLATLKAQAAMGSALKLNLMTYYMEYQYEFKKHPEIGPKDGSLTGEELSALVEYARPLNVEILGNQQSFGHFERILSHEKYAGLRENASVLTPVKDETYQLLDDLYSEVCPRTPFEFFNVCCDETWGLGTGPSRELAQKIGVGKIYVNHLRRIHDLLKDKYKKRMMMWGDIILQHPGDLDQIPKDTIMLTWGYGPRKSFDDQILPFAKSGYEFFVCPGVSNWNCIIPDFAAANVNIQNFVRDGAKNGAIGMLNTDWLDDGEGLKGHKWHGMAWGAECAWNASTTSIDDFNKRIGAVMFGEKGDHFGQAIAILSKPGISGMKNRRFWDPDLAPKTESQRETAQKLLDEVRQAIAHLETCRREAVECGRMDAVANQWVLDSYLHSARRIELIARRTLDGYQAAQAVADAQQAKLPEAVNLLWKAEELMRDLQKEHESLGEEFAGLWLAESKPYALDWTMKRYQAKARQYEEMAQRLAKARAAVEAGQPAPSPRDIGLALPRSGRAALPDVIQPAILKGDAPWRCQAAGRIGLIIEAGNVDRHDLPVEVDLVVPKEWIGKPVAAFRNDAPDVPPIPAQLDPAEKLGRGRLVMIIPGVISVKKPAEYQVYFGADPVTPPTNAVSTRPAPQGAWIENDKVRLLLGKEGAHLYRWEIRALNNRDLTMPGETGWAGFSDTGGEHRSAVNQITCTSQGPAKVRYCCIDPTGLRKFVTLYAGASWVDIEIDPPASYYWDFDDPKNFAGDAPGAGTYLFSSGATGPVGKMSDGVKSQIAADKVTWAMKFNQDKLFMGIILPDGAGRLVVGPGGNWGGVGVERSPGAVRLISVAGILDDDPKQSMQRLAQTLDLRFPPKVTAYRLQTR